MDDKVLFCDCMRQEDVIKTIEICKIDIHFHYYDDDVLYRKKDIIPTISRLGI